MPADDPTSERLALASLTLDPSTLDDLDADLDREWLVTNGLGGYALGTIANVCTRAYHGLLVAALDGPVNRRMLVTKIDEVVTMPDGASVQLGTNEWASGAIAPIGYLRLAGFTLDAGLPRWSFRLGPDATLEKQVWMEHDSNLTYVRYHYAGGPGAAITLALTPFCLDRDHHGNTRGSASRQFAVRQEASACAIQATPDGIVYHLFASPAATFTEQAEWYWGVYHRADHARGLPDTEDVYVPGRFTVALQNGESATLALWAGNDLPAELADLGGPRHEQACEAAYQRERSRRDELLARAGGRVTSVPGFARLTLAADQFLVVRPDTAEGQPGMTVIAGYPWFTDWGRDTMISLAGLTLATGRYEDAATLLRTFARYVSQGMIPNRFPDGSSASQPEYNTVDATLWYFQALRRYLAATDDQSLLRELFPILQDVIDWHVRGTRYGIVMDPRDGLLKSGADGVQLTWMDALVDGWVVTPRRGKPVEISALWYAALALMEQWAGALGADAGRYAAVRTQIEASFFAKYWYPAGGYLYEVVDVDGKDGATDWALRPNQLIALAIAPQLTPAYAASSILDIATRTLVTPLGLRTLTPADPRFIGVYQGDQHARDSAYHQGTVWPWLVGAFVDASRATGFYASEAGLLVDSLSAQLRKTTIGTIGEIADGAPPHHPRGCVAQAWSVAELLRALWEQE